MSIPVASQAIIEYVHVSTRQERAFLLRMTIAGALR